MRNAEFVMRNLIKNAELRMIVGCSKKLNVREQMR